MRAGTNWWPATTSSWPSWNTLRGPCPGGLHRRLREDPACGRCVFFSDNALVYARCTPENEALITSYGIGLDPGRRSIAALEAHAREVGQAGLRRDLAALERMLALAPDDQALALVLGSVLDLDGQSARGAEYLRRAVGHELNTLEARLLLAGALHRAGDPQSAREEIERILSREPDHVPALTLKAELERSAGRLDQAVEILERAAVRAPDSYPFRCGWAPSTPNWAATAPDATSSKRSGFSRGTRRPGGISPGWTG